MSKTVISIDFDGCLFKYEGNFVSEEIISGSPVPGALEWCWNAWRSGKADLIVSSGRCKSEEGIKAIVRWLEWWNFPPMPVSPVKPVAHVYIDDRAYRFDGDWSTVDIDEFVRFRPWWDNRIK